MKTIRLGKTDLNVSRIGIGGIPIQRPPENIAIKVIQKCLDLGVTFIDTSHAYGTSEERIGKAIIGRRESIIIATKTGQRDKTNAINDLNLSLQRLQTDYIDLWQFHNVSSFEKYEQLLKPDGVLEAAQEAIDTGKIHHIGISSHNLDVAEKAILSGHFETIMFPFNFVTNEPLERLVPLAQKYDVGFIAMKPFAGGMLMNANLAIKYLLQFDTVFPIPGVEKVEEIEEIVNITNGTWTLTLQDHKKMDSIRAQLGTRFCRQCGYCQPCPQGVLISMLMIMQVMWKLWPLNIFTEWLGRAVEGGKGCIQCGECEKKCPYHLPIREMISRNIEFYESIVVKNS